MAGQISADPAWKRLYRAGGFSLILAGILFIVNLPLLLIVGPPPTSGEAALAIVAAQNLLFRTSNGIFIASGIVFIPAVLALYLALKELDREYALIASGLAAVAIPIFQTTNMLNYSITGVNNAAVAGLVLGVSRAGDTISVLLFSIAVLIWGVIMRKGVFSKGAAYLGVLTGVVGIISSIPIPAIGLIGLFSLVLFAIWFLAIGSKLYKLG